jgi:hypothetical protein
MTALLRSVHRGFFRRLGFSSREARLLTWGGGCLAVAGWADVSLQNAAETLFLKRVGVAYLPWALLASAILLAVSTYVTARLIAPRNRLRLLPWAFVGLAVSLVALWLLLHLDLPWVFGLLILFSKQFKTVALLIFWTTMGDLVDGRQAKRIYAPLTAGLTIGGIAGSFASEHVGNFLGIEGLVYVAAVVLATGLFFALPLRRASLLGFDPAEDGVRRLAPRPTAATASVSPVPLWRESRLFRVMLLTTICSGILGPILFYQFSYAADLATQGAGGEQSLLRLYARVRGGMNLGVLALQLTVTPRLFGRIGLPAALMLSPLTYLASFLGLAVHPTLAVNIGAVTATRLQGDAVYDPALRVLSNLFPERMRARVTALMEGPVSRTGAVVGNVVVLLALALNPQASGVYAALLVSAAWTVVAFTLWREYPQLLLEALARPDSLGGGQSLSALLNPSTVRVLSAYLSDADEVKCRVALDLLCKAPPATAIEALALAAGKAPAHTRSLLLHALVRACDNPERPAKACPRASGALSEFLENADTLPADQRMLATQAYGMLLGGSLRPTDRVLLDHLRHDREAVVSVAADTALTINGAAPGEGDLDEKLAHVLASPHESVRRTAISELRRLLLRCPIDTRWNERLRMLTAGLDDPEDRPAAAEALADVALRHSTAVERVKDEVVERRNDADVRTRAAVLRFIGRAQLYDRFPCLLSRLSSDDVGEAAAAREGMLALGERVADDLMVQFPGASPKLRRAILGVLHKLGLDAHDAKALIDYEVDGIRRAVTALSVLAPRSDTPPLLLQRLEERVSEALHTLAIILTARVDGSGLGEVDSAIRQTRGERQRAILLEAIERSITPREAARLLPLLESGWCCGRKDAKRALPGGLPSPRDAVRLLTVDPDALTRSLANLAVATLDPPAPMQDDAGVGNLVELALQIKAIPIFGRLSVEQLLDLAKLLREESHPARTVIVREGQFGTGMYVIVDGTVVVVRGEEELAELGPGEFFGEMAVLDGEARSATVRAVTSVRLLRLERADLIALMEENAAIGIAVAQSLAQRLRLRLEREPLRD